MTMNTESVPIGSIMKFISKEPIRSTWHGQKLKIIGYVGHSYVKAELIGEPPKEAQGQFVPNEFEVPLKYLELAEAKTNEEGIALLNQDEW